MFRTVTFALAGKVYWLALLCILMIFSSVYLWQAAAVAHYPITQTLRYSFEVRNQSGEAINSAEIRLFAPLEQTQFQKVQSVQANLPFDWVSDELGQRQMLFTLPLVPPFGMQTLTITAEVQFSSKGNPGFNTVSGDSLASAQYVNVGSAEVRRVSKLLSRDADLIRPEAIYDWLVKNIENVDYIAEDRGSDYALLYKRGDCTEFMYGFLALARANNIPSWGFAGFVVDVSDNRLLASAYHNWNEYKSSDGWFLLDAQRQKINVPDKHYLAFRILGQDAGLKTGNSQRFVAHDQRLALRML